MSGSRPRSQGTPDSAACTDPPNPSAPTIETPRLRLRAFRADDLDARAAIVGDAAFTLYVGGPQSREECWARLQRYVGHWALFGWGLWALEERSTGRLLGEVGLGRFERELGDDFDPYPEGAWVAAPGEGRGYATEAMIAAIGWYEALFGPKRMVCVIAGENGASLRVAEKLGFVRFAERPYKGAPRLLLERAAGAKPVASAPAIG